MKISIITVVYNNVSTLEDAIKSVTSQTYPNIEYIIVDGGSTDGTVDLIKKYETKISNWVSERDKGLYDAMNKGINRATGDVIGILNSDDLYEDSNLITDIAKYFEDQQDIDVLYGDLVYVKPNDVSKVIRKWKSSAYYDQYFENGNVPPHPSLFVKATVYRKAGLFNLQYKLAADYEFMLRILKKYKFKSMYINRLMVRMRLGGATNKSFKNIADGNKEILVAWKENGFKSPFKLMPIRIFKRLTQFF